MQCIALILSIIGRICFYRVFQKTKTHKFLHLINFVAFAMESCCLLPNAWQTLLSANQHKIYVKWLNIVS